ncbi:hypothetical protein [Streptomyces sp. NPDC058657]|uniref:hypothetical protein n=1 Tax=unclassified Streptomyces TaxID=2593676 RepID=UPI003660D949
MSAHDSSRRRHDSTRHPHGAKATAVHRAAGFLTVPGLLASSVLALALAGAASWAALPVGRAATEPVPPAAAAPAAPFGSKCRTAVEGSQVVVHCHNPYPQVDHVRLHTECARWWDIDGDSAATEVGPAQTVRLNGRCWKEVGSVWVSHARTPDTPLAPPAPGGGSR